MLRDDALKGKTIVVTGGGTGLGKAMTRYFLQLGAQCLITSRKDDVIQQTATELSQETNGKCIWSICISADEQHAEAARCSHHRQDPPSSVWRTDRGIFLSPGASAQPLAHRLGRE